MTSITCRELARDVLDRCLAGAPPEVLPRALVEESCASALFSILVEGLADRFEPALCDAYALLFSQALAYVDSTVDAAELRNRYRRVRRVQAFTGEPRVVFVLSRVTLGADVAVTSVVLSAAKERFPGARIVFVGPRKNWELFAADPRLSHAPVGYLRGGLRERTAVWPELRELLSSPDSLVLDPDSRLTQLGLLPVCAEDRYRFFESRAYGAESQASLADLTASWVEEVLGVRGARPFVALPPPEGKAPGITVSFGVGENPAKRLPEPFEEELLRLLGRNGARICVDRGAGGEEAERVTRAAGRAGVEVEFWEGSFAGFAARIAASRLYVGYDSAGQHVAAACGIPLICVFSGFPAERMFQRWRPSAKAAQVIRYTGQSVPEVLEQVAGVVS